MLKAHTINDIIAETSLPRFWISETSKRPELLRCMLVATVGLKKGATIRRARMSILIGKTNL